MHSICLVDVQFVYSLCRSLSPSHPMRIFHFIQLFDLLGVTQFKAEFCCFLIRSKNELNSKQ